MGKEMEGCILKIFLVVIAVLLTMGLVQHGDTMSDEDWTLVGLAIGVMAYPLWSAIGWRNAFRIALVIVAIAIVWYFIGYNIEG
jgi:hypothetical protein